MDRQLEGFIATVHLLSHSVLKVPSHRPLSPGQGDMNSTRRLRHRDPHLWLSHLVLVQVRSYVRNRCSQLNNNSGITVIGRAYPAARPGRPDDLLFEGLNLAHMPDVPHYVGSLPSSSTTHRFAAPRRRR